jgi:putative transposase
MARPLRIQAPGLWHHVMNRGVARGDVFVDSQDREGFLGLLAEVRERWGMRTHAACLMGNHFHLLVEDVQGSLARSMRHVVGVHTQRFNARHNRDGPLFRGRFRSRLVQQERYLAELVRYIHMNPVHAGLVAHAGDYAWSSHGHYLSGEAPAWLVSEEVLRRFGGDAEALDRFVHERLSAERRAELRWDAQPNAVGDAAFVARWQERRERSESTREHAGGAGRESVATDCDAVIEAVSAHFGVSSADVRRGGRGRANVARQAAILISVDHCPQPATVIARALQLHPRSLSAIACRHRHKLGHDEAFRAEVHAVLDRLRADGLKLSTGS